MNQLFPVARVIVAACLLAAAPRAIHAQTNDSLPAAARASDNEESLRLAQREIAQAQREVLLAQREVQREAASAQREVASVQREAMAAQRQATLSTQREAMEAQREAMAAGRESQELVRAQSIAIREAAREAAMAQRQAAMALREARLEETRKMIDEMVKDHLINRTNDIHIEFRDEHLYINGKEQPKAVYDKYKPFFHQNNQDLRLNLGQGIAI